MVDDESNRTITSTPGQKFGRRLREQRERHQITLDAIASSTKIKMSLFAGLEREAGTRATRDAPERLEPMVAEKRDRLYLVKPAAESDAALAEQPADRDTDSPFPRSAVR